MANKNCGLRIRVEKDLRDQFVEVCRRKDVPASQVLREFMRNYLADEITLAQGSLFEQEKD